MIKKKIRNSSASKKYKELIIVYLSDSKASETNIHYRLTIILSAEFFDYKITDKYLPRWVVYLVQSFDRCIII